MSEKLHESPAVKELQAQLAKSPAEVRPETIEQAMAAVGSAGKGMLEAKKVLLQNVIAYLGQQSEALKQDANRSIGEKLSTLRTVLDASIKGDMTPLERLRGDSATVATGLLKQGDSGVKNFNDMIPQFPGRGLLIGLLTVLGIKGAYNLFTKKKAAPAETKSAAPEAKPAPAADKPGFVRRWFAPIAAGVGLTWFLNRNKSPAEAKPNLPPKT